MESAQRSSFTSVDTSTISIRDVVIFATVFLFVRWCFLSKKSNTHSSAPPLPYPPGLPFFGNIFSFRIDMRFVLRNWTNELGGLYRLRLGPMKDMVVISDIDAIHEAFVEQADAFSDRDIPPLLDLAVGPQGSILWERGEKWKKIRKFGHRALRSFGLGQRSMEERVIEEGRVLVETFENLKEEPINTRVFITNATSNVISSVVLGYRYEYDDPVFKKLVNDFEKFITAFSLTSIGMVFPFLYYTPLYTNLRRPIRDIVAFIRSNVKQHRNSFDPQDVRDIMDLHLVEMKQKRDTSEMGAIEDGWEWKFIFELFAAGMTTTSDTLQWAVLIVAQHPQLMQEIQKEIDDVIGEGRSPKLADQSLMPLTEATLMEVGRFRPVVPLGVPRFTTRDTILKGYHIPKDTTVAMNLWETMNSPKYWDEPDTFNPYRFLSADRHSIVNHPALISFGIGSRVCLGEKLARMELFIIFTSLLQRFTFRLADDSRDVGMQGKAGATYTPLHHNIIFEKRHV